MTAKGLFVIAMAVVLLASVSVAQGPKKDVGTKVPLPPISADDPAKQPDPQRPEAGLSIDVDLVSMDVVVTNNNGDPISGLEQKDFKVFEDDVLQTITNFSSTEAPLTVVVLAEFGDTFGYYYDDVVGPAAGFIQSLRPDDWAALVAYDIRPEILTDFTKNKDELFDGLRRMRTPAYHETCLYDAVYDTLQRLENVDGKKAIFLLSTGLDTFSKHTYGEALRKAETSDTMIYSVSMGQLARLYMENQVGPETNIQFLQADNVLRSLAEATGGAAFFPRFQGQYPSIYESVAANLRNQYSIGFVPKIRKTDGKLHKLRVEVPNTLDVNGDGKPDKLKVRHKKGYYAAKT
jgi:VWFA-related protein